MRIGTLPRISRLWIGLALAIAGARGQDVADAQQQIQSLLARIQALEQKVEQLTQGAAPNENRPAALPGSVHESNAPEADTPDSVSESIAPDSPAAPPSWINRVRVHAYADAEFVRHEAPGEPDHYQVGELVLFGTAPLSSDISALAEVALHTEDASQLGDLAISVERLLLEYRYNDYLHVAAGQFRTDIGYYSTAYLRGAWFQTAATRPRLFAFEEDGGILPLHNVGVSVSGKIPSGWLGLHYTAETGNSVTWGSPQANALTKASHQGLNFVLTSRPRAIEGLEIGLSAYHDHFLPIPVLDLARSVWSAHVVYTANRVEFLNEGVVSNIRFDPAHATGTLSGFYSQLAYRAGSGWTPYLRVEKLTVHGSSFFDSISNLVPWRSMYNGGLRYDWKESIALKFELGHEADIGIPHFYRAAAEVAFAF